MTLPRLGLSSLTDEMTVKLLDEEILNQRDYKQKIKQFSAEKNMKKSKLNISEEIEEEEEGNLAKPLTEKELKLSEEIDEEIDSEWTEEEEDLAEPLTLKERMETIGEEDMDIFINSFKESGLKRWTKKIDHKTGDVTWID